ncbi:MAG: hypothetical protein ACXV7J_14755 [Methylomonas sp.]
MKERITMQRLMQEGWIPALIGILSASVIVSMAHSTGMAYVTAFLLLTLYFVAIAANRVNATAIAAAIAKRILQQAFEKISGMLCVRALGDLSKNVLSLWFMQIDSTKNRIEKSIAAFTDRFAGLVARIESLLSTFIGSTSLATGDGIAVMLKNSKIIVGNLIQVIKRAV